MPDMSVRRPVGALLATAVALPALSACNLERRSFEDSATERVGITEIRIESSNGKGNVVVQPGDRSQVEIRRTVSYRGERPTQRTYSIESSVLRLHTSCRRDNCTVSYTVKAPKGVRVLGENGAGDLRVSGVSTVDAKVGKGDVAVRDSTGAVDVRTGSGNVELVDLRGPTNVKVSTGDIQAYGVRTTALTAETSSGNLRLETLVPADVRAKTSSGDIRLVVPSGEYHVNAVTKSGNVDVRVVHDPTAARTLDLETKDGDIAVNPR